VLRDEGLVVPIGGFSRLPGVIGREGLRQFYPPALSEEEVRLLDRSVAALRKAGERLSEG
jgi:malate/lactate dehydrogenase